MDNELYDKRWQDAIDLIAGDRMSGSTAIALKAVVLLKEFYFGNPGCRKSEIRELAELVIKAKPAMAALKNTVNGTISLIESGNGEKSFPGIMHSIAIAQIDMLNKAMNSIGRIKSVLTCSFSSAVIDFLKMARAINQALKIHVLESESGGIKYGIKLGEELRKSGIECEVYPDSCADEAINITECIVTGADAVIGGSGIVNGSPSLMLAEKAIDKIPYYIIAESFKRTNEIITTKGFEFVPLNLITEIFTDNIFPISLQNAEMLISHFNLKPHPEGGYYTETYRSEEILDVAWLPDRYTGSRALSTNIYFLLESGQVSKWHRLKTDETWHFYFGCPLELVYIDETGEFKKALLGNNIPNSEAPQITVPRNCWMAAKPVENYSFSFVGCTLSPGFSFDDFDLGNTDDLISKYPNLWNIIIDYS